MSGSARKRNRRRWRRHGRSGLGRGSGTPGLPGQTVLRTNREAKPIQTVRATYPAMALRAGLKAM